MAIAFMQEWPIQDGDTSTTNYDAISAELNLQQAPDGLLTRGDLDLFFLGDSPRVLDRNGGRPAAKLDLALPQASWRMIRESRSNFVQAGFLAARTGVEYENFH